MSFDPNASQIRGEKTVFLLVLVIGKTVIVCIVPPTLLSTDAFLPLLPRARGIIGLTLWWCLNTMIAKPYGLTKSINLHS